MKVLNWSYWVGCLQCSFNDMELNEYIQLKKRRSSLQKKSAMHNIGKQSDKTWILGENLCISSSGLLISNSESKHVWIGSVFNGPGIPPQSVECKIILPLSIDPLNSLIKVLALRFLLSCITTLWSDMFCTALPGANSAITLLSHTISIWS